MSAAITSIKGFGLDWKCRDFQFALGQTYTHDGPVAACQSGFHAIEGNPLEVFDYYPPGTSRYAEVDQFGGLSRHHGDSKLASATIRIKAELHIPAIVERAVKWMIAHCSPSKSNHAEGPQSAASSTGYRSAASSTGTQSAASSTGDRSAASSTGYQSAASSTGDHSAASSTGYRSAAMACGMQGCVMAEKDGCALFIVFRNSSTLEIEHAWSGITGRDGIKAGVWYRLQSDGQPVEVSA